MKIQIRNDLVVIEGYVNAVERFSKPLYDTRGKFIEKIEPNVFKRAIKNNDDILTLLNHDYDKVLARTGDNTAVLEEDNIGLKARVEISDKDVIKKAKERKLKGWSFGFIAKDEDRKLNDSGVEERTVKEIELKEISIIDDRKSPAYQGTSIEVREKNTFVIEYRSEDEETETIDNTTEESKKELTYNQKQELLTNSIHEEEKVDLYINDFTENFVYVYFVEENQVYKISYEIKENKVNFDFNNKIKVKQEYVEERSDIYKYKNRLNRLKVNN